jgi:protoporphyrin/coproporphyrin ferrochelatase
MAYYRAAPLPAESMPPRVGVLLVNLGTPDSPSYRDVQRYLREFLSDRRVIDTARPVWLPLLYGVVLPFRPFKTARNYRKVWMPEGSPLAVYSRRLALKIAALLKDGLGDSVRVELAMTYGSPSIAAGIENLARHNVRKLVVLPLYPHYCSSTTGSVFDRLSAELRRWRWLPELSFINDYHDDAGFIEALSEAVEKHWLEVGARSHLLFSYHGIPASYVANGDPYQRQAEATTRLVVARLGLKEGEWSHCYQSRFGRVVWLKPYTVDTIEALAKRGERRLTVVSPSFAVDCLETLEEVGMEYRDQFLAQGGSELRLVPGLNDGERHAGALAALILRRTLKQC